MSSCGNDRRNHTQPRRVNPTRADEIISFCSATQLFYRLNRDIPQQPEQAICTVFVCRHFSQYSRGTTVLCSKFISPQSCSLPYIRVYSRSFSASAALHSCGSIRHCQFPEATPGVLTLPSAESPRTSCICAIKIPAGEHMPPRIIPQLMPSAAFSARYCSANLRSGSEASANHCIIGALSCVPV